MHSRASEGVVLELIELAYRAAEEPAVWEVFLRRLATALGGFQAALVHDELPGKATFASAVNVDPACMTAYENYYAERNAWALAGRHRFSEGAILLGEDYLSDSELVKTEYYNDFLRYFDLRHVIGALPQFSGKAHSQVSILRSGRAGPFGEDAVRILEVVTPHLRRALRLHERLTDLGIRSRASTAALDALPTGVILIGSGAQVIFMNRAAREILADRQGLTYERSHLHASTAQLTASLHGLIREAISTANNPGSCRGGAIALPRPDGRPSLEVRVSPLNLAQMDLGNERVAGIVFVADPERRPRADPSILMKLYGFTNAEARLAAFLAEGKGALTAADALGITANTVRTHLHSLFRKTGTNRQAELVGLICGGLAMGRWE